MDPFEIRPITDTDRAFIGQLILERWGSEEIIVHDELFLPAELPGFVYIRDEKITGLITFNISGEVCEIISLDSLCENLGVGSALVEHTAAAACDSGCRRLTLVTTNDNLHALGFYQKRGFRISRVLSDAVMRSRLRKPSIPMIGENGIPITDEIILVRELENGS